MRNKPLIPDEQPFSDAKCLREEELSIVHAIDPGMSVRFTVQTHDQKDDDSGEGACREEQDRTPA
jgi:hypothetical protein